MEYESSSIDWCEENYSHSIYIAEFFNTISNIPFIILYYFGCKSFCNMFCNNYDKLLYGCLLFTGISSFYFHATLSLFSQLLDEFSIIFLLFNTLLMLYKDNNKRLFIKSYTITHSIVMCYYPVINIPVLFLIGFYLWSILRKRFRKYKENSFRRYWYRAQIFFILSLICWFSDKAADLQENFVKFANAKFMNTAGIWETWNEKVEQEASYLGKSLIADPSGFDYNLQLFIMLMLKILQLMLQHLLK